MIYFNHLHFDSVQSTNDLAMQRISEGRAREGDVISASWQKEGRGHAKNVWESEANKNLLCSIILMPHHVSPASQFVLTQVLSLGVLAAIKQYLPDENCYVKWPNDLYINDRKVGGILFQNIIKGHQIEYSVAGLGLNVNQSIFSSQLPNPISMRKLISKDVDLEQFLHSVTRSINEYYQLTFSQKGIDHLNEKYHVSLFRVNEWGTYKRGETIFEGRISGVDEFGRLSVEQRDGQRYWFQFKEIEYLF